MEQNRTGPGSPIERPLPELRDVTRTRILVGVIIAVVSVGVSIANYFGAPPELARRPLAVVFSPQVFATFVTGTLAVISTLTPKLKLLQVILLIGNGYVGALINEPGNLTSFVLVLLGLFLANEYGYLQRSAARRSGILIAVYGVVVAVGLPFIWGASVSQTIVTLLGAVAVGALSWAVIVLRARDRDRRERELESKVQERTSELSNALSEQKLLLAELHHRTKNNLQLVSSILSLGKHGETDTVTRSSIESGQMRINALGRMHDQLYAETGRGDTDVNSFLENYLTDAQMMAGPERCLIHSELNVSGRVSLDLAIRLALALNEIVMDTIEYAESAGRTVVLAVSALETENDVMLTTRDDGGEPAGDDDRVSGTGVDIIRAMVRRVGGSAELRMENGVVWEISLPLGFGRSSFDFPDRT